MGVRADCRHYVRRTGTAGGEAIERCRLSIAAEAPFSCPDDCLFFEARPYSGAGWTPAPETRMSNTADALNALPPAKKRGKGRKPRG